MQLTIILTVAAVLIFPNFPGSKTWAVVKSVLIPFFPNQLTGLVIYSVIFFSCPVDKIVLWGEYIEIQ